MTGWWEASKNKEIKGETTLEENGLIQVRLCRGCGACRREADSHQGKRLSSSNMISLRAGPSDGHDGRRRRCDYEAELKGVFFHYRRFVISN